MSVDHIRKTVRNKKCKRCGIEESCGRFIGDSVLKWVGHIVRTERVGVEKRISAR